MVIDNQNPISVWTTSRGDDSNKIPANIKPLIAPHIGASSLRSFSTSNNPYVNTTPCKNANLKSNKLKSESECKRIPLSNKSQTKKSVTLIDHHSTS